MTSHGRSVCPPPLPYAKTQHTRGRVCQCIACGLSDASSTSGQLHLNEACSLTPLALLLSVQASAMAAAAPLPHLHLMLLLLQLRLLWHPSSCDGTRV